jgi:MerR family transcriptional regulator, copper efflux regulator
MLISEFARATGLSRDTVRFYVRRGLLAPLAGNKGGSNPYQVFTNEHVQMARTIRMAQSLGFSLREIEAINKEYQAKRMSASRGAEILRWQLTRLEEKAAHVDAMIDYIHAKLAWLAAGSEGPEPNFTDYEKRAGGTGRKSLAQPRRNGGKASAVARKGGHNGGNGARSLGK